MRVQTEITLKSFNAWSGAKDTKETIIDAGMAEEFDRLIEELYPDGIDETRLNDVLWFDADWIYGTLGIETED